ncbi:MAG: fused MFS/spermidine synthase [Deltaproteobacteria bacterium]|nr:fused MFS/spermidine synthase [Deltaproteobacteria bacterium]
MRSAGLVMGQTATTTAAVLSSYFAGLGIGAACARTTVSRPIRLYGWLEVGTAAGAAWSLFLFQTVDRAEAQAWLAEAGAGSQIAVVVAALLPATLCLGASLPAIGQVLAAQSAGRRGGMLYGLNTLGGVAGVAATGFTLPAAIGVHASYLLVASSSASAGVIALIVGYRHPTLAAPAPTAPANCSNHRNAFRWRLRIVAAGTGALALALEVVWTRMFAQVLHNSVYSFSAIALVFLVAIAGGAFIAASTAYREAALRIATAALIASGFLTVTGFWLFVWRTNGLAYFGMLSGLDEYIARIVALAALCAGPAALASGAVLPSLWEIWGANEGAARPLGDLAAANTFGGVAGALATGFVLVPTIGVRGTLMAAAVSYVALAEVLVLNARRQKLDGWRPVAWRLVAYAVLLFVFIANPMRAPIVHLQTQGETLLSTREGSSGIVTVVRTADDLQLKLDNYYLLGGSAAAAGERRLGLVPLLLHPLPRRALFVGLATGITASAAPALAVTDTTIIELVPEVVAAAKRFFAIQNGDLLDRPDVHVIVGDGRHYLAAPGEPFDVIVSDLFVPWHAGAGSMYSREMYENVARRLTPGGLFCQWLPLYQLTRDEFDLITRTMLSVFPRLTLWRADFYADRPVVGLVAQLTPWSIDLARAAERVRNLPAWSEDVLLASERGLAMLYAGDISSSAALFTGSTLNTDDRPLLEFEAPRLTRINANGDKDWFTGEPLATLYDALQATPASAPSLVPESDATRDASRAGTQLYRYAVAATGGDAARAAALQTEVSRLVPEVVAAADASQPRALAAARATFDRLRSEQTSLQQQIEAVQRRLDDVRAAKEPK